VAQKPRDAVVNFFLSKFTAASRGPPCDSTALVCDATSRFKPNFAAARLSKPANKGLINRRGVYTLYVFKITQLVAAAAVASNKCIN